MRLRYKLGLSLVVICLAICLMTYQSYALWVVNLKGEENIVETGCFSISFTELSSSISLLNTYPMSDERALTQTPYSFKIKNTCSIASSYLVTLNTLTTNELTKDKMKFAIGSQKPSAGINLETHASNPENINHDTSSFYMEDLEESIILETGQLKPEEEVTYNLYLWIDQESGNEVMGKSFQASVHVISNAVQLEQSFCEKNPTTFACELLANGQTNELKFDNTSDNNLRYVGENPNNYVWFGETYQTDIYDVKEENVYWGLNSSTLEECIEMGTEENCEKKYSAGDKILWRIIGVMNNVEDGSKKKASRIKLLREDSIGIYSWDSSPEEINNGSGVNEWSQADINIVLNDYYYNGKSDQICYTDINNTSKPCDFSSIGISENLKNMIEPAVWYTGSNEKKPEDFNWFEIIAPDSYVFERSNNIGKGCSDERIDCTDTVERKTSWTGLVGLMYPSDYGYASYEADNTTCEKFVFSAVCRNWIENLQNNLQWTITPLSHQYNAAAVYFTGSYDDTLRPVGSPNISTRPSVYLKSSIKKVSGSGTKENPFMLGN